MTIFLLRTAFFTCLMFVLTTLGAKLWLDWRNNSADLLQSLILFVLAFVVMQEPLHCYFNRPATRVVHTESKDKKCHIGALTCNAVLAALIAILVACQIQSGGLLLAVTLDHAGLYELGERVYAATVHEGDNSLASIAPLYLHDAKSKAECQRLSRFVADVYGKESVQMSRRYTVAGIHRQMKGDFVGAAEFYERASILYQKAGDKRWGLSTLHFLAFAQYSCNKVDAVEETLTRACASIPNLPYNARDLDDLEVLRIVAHSTGRSKQEAVFAHALESKI